MIYNRQFLASEKGREDGREKSIASENRLNWSVGPFLNSEFIYFSFILSSSNQWIEIAVCMYLSGPSPIHLAACNSWEKWFVSHSFVFLLYMLCISFDLCIFFVYKYLCCYTATAATASFSIFLFYHPYPDYGPPLLNSHTLPRLFVAFHLILLAQNWIIMSTI